MPNWIFLATSAWMVLIATVVILAISRTVTSHRDRKLVRAGSGADTPLHVHLRHLIQTEDRIGATLTLTAIVFGVILALLLINRLFEAGLHKIVQALSFQ